MIDTVAIGYANIDESIKAGWLLLRIKRATGQSTNQRIN